MTSQRRTIANSVFAQIATNDQLDPDTRLRAASLLDDTDYSAQYAARWHEVSVRDLALFALKCVVAATPAVLLAVVLWIFFIVFNGVAAQVLGGL